MSRKHASTNIAPVGQIVNGLATILAVSLVAVGYFSALGQFAMVV